MHYAIVVTPLIRILVGSGLGVDDGGLKTNTTRAVTGMHVYSSATLVDELLFSASCAGRVVALLSLLGEPAQARTEEAYREPPL